MFEIKAIGGAEFTLGFRLAGIKTEEVTDNIEDKFMQLSEDENLGIIITDDKTFNSLPEHIQEKVEGMVKPVTVVVSTDAASQDTLRKKIKKSIGVDLWKD